MWDDARQLNATAAVIATLAFLALGWGALDWLARRPLFGFQEIVVHTPLTKVNAAQLEIVVRDELKGTFFTMNLDRSRAALARVPWIRRAALRRQWPHRLEITLEEHVALARWNDAALVNTSGEVFNAVEKARLPRFTGPEGSAGEIARRYAEWSTALAPLKLEVTEVRLSARGAWHLDVSGQDGALALELGRDDPGALLTRFVAMYDRTIGTLARNGTRVPQVDLRYRNGFAARVPGFRERTGKKIA